MRPALLLALAMVLGLTEHVFAASPNVVVDLSRAAGTMVAQVDPDKPLDEKDTPPPEPAPQPEPQAPPASAPIEPPVDDASSFWTHNGSIMALQAQGEQRVFSYDQPREGILNQGAVRGTVLFRGVSRGGVYSGTAFIFSNRCGARAFPASGEASPDSRHIVVRGRAPLLGPLCRIRGLKDVTLIFDYLSKTR